mmetsp:Transcript_42285/g.40503  ORF Transcript_42285/g.40503 Transcript_42285/m.40503 type:complete len:216 (+) Transcript_42285:1094-1741(+)
MARILIRIQGLFLDGLGGFAGGVAVALEGHLLEPARIHPLPHHLLLHKHKRPIQALNFLVRLQAGDPLVELVFLDAHEVDVPGLVLGVVVDDLEEEEALLHLVVLDDQAHVNDIDGVEVVGGVLLLHVEVLVEEELVGGEEGEAVVQLHLVAGQLLEDLVELPLHAHLQHLLQLPHHVLLAPIALLLRLAIQRLIGVAQQPLVPLSLHDLHPLLH